MTVGAGMVYTLKPDSSAGEYIGWQISAGIGSGLVIQLPVIVAQAISTRADLAVTVAISLCKPLPPPFPPAPFPSPCPESIIYQPFDLSKTILSLPIYRRYPRCIRRPKHPEQRPSLRPTNRQPEHHACQSPGCRIHGSAKKLPEHTGPRYCRERIYEGPSRGLDLEYRSFGTGISALLCDGVEERAPGRCKEES